ncbi:MAG: transglutaminase domain-containing protein [Oscillospiraceae bacterium]|jgi:hypothetical protein|nr:transglutaminase domain-containing protein [Oscillospiraceae bacterium]
MAEQERRFSWCVLLGDGILMLCALCGLTGAFLSLYGGRQAAPWADTTVLVRCALQTDFFYVLSALFALTALAAWSLPRFRGLAAGGLAAAWALAVWRSWRAVRSGAVFTAKIIADLFEARVSWGRTFDYSPGVTLNQTTADVRLFLLFSIALLALVLGWVVVRSRRWWMAVLLTLPPLLPGLVADLYPSWPAFLALSLCWCVMLLTSLCKWSAPSARGRLTLAALGCTAAVLWGVALAFPEEGYIRPPWALEAERELLDLTNRAADFWAQWDGPFQRTITYVGSAGEADLTQAGPLNYYGRTVLRLTSDYSGRLYLRGSSLAVYEDGVWKALPEGAYQRYLDSLENPDDAPSPLLFPAGQGLAAAAAAGSGRYTATVDNVGAVGSCVYAPYFLTEQDWEERGILPVEDAYFAGLQGQRSFTVEFIQQEPLNVVPASSRWSEAYWDQMEMDYLAVPKEMREELKELCWRINAVSSISLYGEDSTSGVNVQLARRVAQYLDALCEYDPDVPAVPEGKDPVLYFLMESRRGYCMHYASAATLLLRAMGVPARYVSGFAAESVPGQTVDVPDRAAHAWVEVWVDSFGWHPVEVTPAAAFAEDQEEADIPGPLETHSAPPEETQTPVPSQESEMEPEETLPGGEDSSEEGKDAISLPGWLKWLAGAAGVSALMWLGQFGIKRLRGRQMDGPDPNRAALYVYGCLLRMERWGGRVDERAVVLAQKAKFSQHTLTREELGELRTMADRERGRLCAALGPVKRGLFRYFWGKPLTSRENHV